MTEKKPTGILQYWQPLLGIITFVAAAGMFYSRVLQIEQKQVEQDGRYQRQFELINKISDRVTVLEKESAYQKGLRDGLNEKK